MKANMITGLVGVALSVVFLGNYALQINSLPLWLIICAVLLMVIVDYLQSLRQNGNP